MIMNFRQLTGSHILVELDVDKDNLQSLTNKVKKITGVVDKEPYFIDSGKQITEVNRDIMLGWRFLTCIHIVWRNKDYIGTLG